MASAEEGSEPLKYQTWTLKVSIHCEGCKKKVKKVLHSIEGVYKTTVDSQQQKVIVIGNVEAETLIKKLLKTGKHAELWPEKKPNNPGNNNSGGGCGGGGKKNKNKNKASGKPNESSENPESNQTPTADDSSPDSSANPDGDAPNNGRKDSPKVDNKEAGNSPPPEKQGGAAAASAGGGGGKKKGKKGQKENNGGGGGGGGGCGGGGGGGEVQGASEGMGSKPGSGGASVVSLPAFSYAVYPTSQPPAYVVSYSTVQPSASYGGAYYPMSANQSSYFYSGATVAAAPGSYYIFSDENANACRIM